MNLQLPKFDLFSVLLQHGADPSIRNTDGKTACDLADPGAKDVLTGILLFMPILTLHKIKLPNC